MAECHPVGFQWVMEAKARGAKVIHIDPRFTRTSAVADQHVPIRVGSDIAFLGGVVNHILSNDLDFREYVVAYTNAANIVGEDFVDTEDLDGLFSGYDPDTASYDRTTWGFEGATGAEGSSDQHDLVEGDQGGGHFDARGVQRDPTLQDPRCVFQVLKRHYARYTPEVVQQVCGVPPEQFLAVCEAVTANSGRERTTAWVYSVGWTHHSTGVQYIRGSAIIQLLLAQGATKIIGCGRGGAVHSGQKDMDQFRSWIAEHTNGSNLVGSLKEVLVGADVFIGVSAPNLLTGEDIATMAEDAIVFALANPVSEVDPVEASKHAAVVATGRSDYPNQINNVLVFPGFFRGLLDAGVSDITNDMLIAAAQAIADKVLPEQLNASYIVPSVFDVTVAPAVAAAVLAKATARQ